MNKYDPWKKEGVFVLSSGKTVHNYYDLKEMMGDPKVLMEEVMEIKNSKTLVEWSKIDVIIGIDYGGTPLAIALATVTNIPYAIIRKDEKDHGTRKRIEGSPKIGKTLLLDDVRTGGDSMHDARMYLENKGYTIIETIVLLDRDDMVEL